MKIQRVEERPEDESDFVKPDDFSDPLLVEYKQKLLESNGYHAIALPPHLQAHTRSYAEFNDEILQQLSEAALNSFNKANEESEEPIFVLHSVIMGNWSNSFGKLYKVTFRARSSDSDHDNDIDINEFQVVVRYIPSDEQFHLSVGDCTLQTERKYPLSFEEKDLLEFSEKAVQFFNQKHQGSQFVLHSAVNGNYTPIIGYPFRVMFRARASNEEDIREFEAKLILNFPWVQSERVYVLECVLKEEALYPYNPKSKSKEKEDACLKSAKTNTAKISDDITRKFVAYEMLAKEEDCSALFIEEYMKHVNSLNTMFGHAQRFDQNMGIERNSEILQEMAWAAIDFFNKANVGASFVFHSVVLGNFVFLPRRIYDIVFRARPLISNGDDDIKEFVAVTQLRIPPEKDILVLNCVIKSDREYALDIKHHDLLVRNYVLDFTSNALAEYSEESLRHFNEKHEGSDYVLHSVVNVAETSTFGAPFTVTFRAKASNEEDLKDFVAKLKHNLRRKKVEDGVFRRVTVLGCEIKNREEESLRARLEKGKAKFDEETREPELENPLLLQFKETFNESKGFHAIDIPTKLIYQLNVYPEFNKKYLVEVSKAAIDFYNDAHGSDFVFHSIVMGNFHGCAGRFYRVTFRARSSKSDESDYDKIREFQAQASHRPWMEKVVHVSDCSLKPVNEYPIDFEESSLVDFSKRAVNFFNENHEGSQFVYHSVVKCSNYTPINRSHVELTFKASNTGDENDIREFEALLGLDITKVPFSAFPCKCAMKSKSESESESKMDTSGG